MQISEGSNRVFLSRNEHLGQVFSRSPLAFWLKTDSKANFETLHFKIQSRQGYRRGCGTSASTTSLVAGSLLTEGLRAAGHFFRWQELRAAVEEPEMLYGIANCGSDRKNAAGSPKNVARSEAGWHPDCRRQ